MEVSIDPRRTASRVFLRLGTLVTVPCSHVGHIFRKRSPYKWLPGVNVVKKNAVRVAEVWLDDYKVTKAEKRQSALNIHLEILLRAIQL